MTQPTHPADPVAAAEGHFSGTHNCAQAVLAAFSPLHGLDAQTAARLATAFGGGISRRGEMCGAVSGALIVLGLAQGAATPEAKEKVYALAQEFMRRFNAASGGVLCRDLLQVDISTPAGLQKAHESGITRQVCPAAVRQAALILQYILAAE
jgi:C_GCAxxG_C_C family probable redox protein